MKGTDRLMTRGGGVNRRSMSSMIRKDTVTVATATNVCVTHVWRSASKNSECDAVYAT